MKRFDDYRMRLMLVVFVAAVVLSSQSTWADFAFSEPFNMGPTVNSSAGPSDPEISADGLTLYFASTRPGGYGDNDLWMTMREMQDKPWGSCVNLGPAVNSSADDRGSSISADGLELYFMSTRPGGYGSYDIWVARRATTDDDWGEPVNLGPNVNTSADDGDPCILADGLSLYFASKRPGGEGGMDVYVTTRARKNDDWGIAMSSGLTLNSPSNDGPSWISADGLVIFFHSDRPGGYGSDDLYVARRQTEFFPWARCMNLGPTINSSASDYAPSISTDGLTLYFSSNRPGGLGGSYADIYQAPIVPIVDFNSDGVVDTADMCIMVDYWGTDEPSCDIGPMPWGDGIVNAQDMSVLAEHMFEEVEDPTLMVHWKLDETEGDIAYDSASCNDGILNGSPLWQPAGAQIGGALAFDGMDDYVSADFVLDPAGGPFRLFAWVKGGAPSQVVLSQIGGANWLCTDPSEGNLMTEIKSPDWYAKAMVSQINIADGEWHRVGLMWYRCRRTLYVDDVEVAKDTELQYNLEAAYGGLYFGASSTLDAASFFSGLIDDVRIYRVVRP
jgi:hypothetical protein